MNKIVKNAVILTVITLVSGLLLGFVYEITKAPIAAAQENAKQKAYKEVLKDAKEFETYADFNEKDAQKILDSAGLNEEYISEVAIAKDGSGEVMGYVVTAVTKEGYGGEIKVSVGILNDGTVAGIEILSISETAGLGMKAAEPEFKNQFKDKKVEKFAYTKTGEEGDDKIDALSGATITTNAVTNAVDAGLVYFQNVLGGGNADE